MITTPLRYDGVGEFHAIGHHAKRLDKELVVGEVLAWEQVEHRSTESHRHYFACIKDAWANLPEKLVGDFVNPEHLRKYALIKAGYCTVKKIVCRSNLDAVEACGLLAAMDPYSILEIVGNVLTVYRAESQKMKLMGKKRFQESKDAVLMVLSQLIGADAGQGGNAA